MTSRTPIASNIRPTVLFVCIWLALLSSAVAQGKWTIDYGADVAKQVRSIELPGENFQVAHNFTSGMALLKADSPDKPTQLISLNLRTLHVGAPKEMPAHWNWQTTTVGDKYACCVDDNVLMLLDLSTCTVIGQCDVPRTDEVRILFDKAVWLRPGYWYALPSLKEVKDHAIVHAVAGERLRLGLQTSAPVVRSNDSCFIDGVEHNSRFEPKGNFVGHFKDSNPLPANVSSYTASIVKSAESDPKSTEILLRLSLEPLGIQTEDKRNAIYATNPNRQGLEENRSLPIYRYSQGLFTFAQNDLICIPFNKKYQPPLEGVALDYQPPLLPTDGSTYTGPVSSRNGQEIRAISFFHPAWQVDAQLSEDKKTFSARLLPRREPVTVDDWKPLEEVVTQVVGLAQLDLSASWEEIEATYKKNNLYWLAPYAQGLGRKFDGIPVEVPVGTAQGSGSIVIDFPSKTLQDVFQRLQARSREEQRVLAAVPVVDTLPERLAAFERRPKQFTLPIAKPLPELPQLTLPPSPNLSAIQGKLDLGLMFAITLWPIAILFRTFYLFAGVHVCNRYASDSSEAIQFVGGYMGYFLAASAWFLLMQGSALCIDWVTDDFVINSAGLFFLRGTLKVLLDIALLWLVATLASQRTPGEMLPLTLGISAVLLLSMLRALPAMFRVLNG